MTDRLKVINLGLPKSGTTTFGRAMAEAGFAVADWRIRRRDPNATAFGYVGNLMYHAYFKTGDPLALMENFTAFAEISIVRDGFNLWPQTDWGLIDAIRRRHPGARFVLTMRDPAKIADSMLRWSNLGRTRLPENEIPGLPRPYGGTDAERIRWVEGHAAFCRQMFSGSDDFLELPLEDEDTPARLAEFLGRPLPWWGVANQNTNHAPDDAARRAQLRKARRRAAKRAAERAAKPTGAKPTAAKPTADKAQGTPPPPPASPPRDGR